VLPQVKTAGMPFIKHTVFVLHAVVTSLVLSAVACIFAGIHMHGMLDVITSTMDFYKHSDHGMT